VTTASSPFDRFWDSPNEVDPQALPEGLRELVAQLEGRIARGARRSVLPAKVAGVTRWYGFSPTDREQRTLAEELRAWLGPPMSSGPRLVDDDGDELDRLASALAPGSQVLRLNVHPPWQEVARRNVLRLANLWDLAPEGGEDIARPVGRVLRQFYESIASGTRDRAEEALDEIAERALLSPTNLRFLRVELLGSVGTPQELRDHSEIGGLTSLTLPPTVREYLAQAANSLYIDPVADEANPDWQSVGRSIESNWPALCERIDQSRSTATARCLALVEALREAPRQGVIRFLLDEWGSDSVVTDVLSPVAHVGEASSLQHDDPLHAYRNGDYLTVLQLVEDRDASVDDISVALLAAANLDDVEAAVRALALVNALSTPLRDELLSVHVNSNSYQVLTERVGGATMPTGWLEWFEGDWADRPDRLRDWAATWSSPEEVGELKALELALSLVEALRGAQRGRVRNGLPILVEWLLGEPTDATQPNIVAILTVIAEATLTVEPGPGERLAALELIDEVLSVGGSVEEYRRLLDALDSQLDGGKLGPREAPWLSACIDVLLATSSNDLSKRNELLSRALGVATTWGQRLNAGDALTLKKAFGEAELTFVLPERHEAGGLEARPRRTPDRVGIYTLQEQSGGKAREWIEDLLPGVEVNLSSDKVRTRELDAMVRGADVLLMQVSRATHAATNAIRAALDDPSRLVYVNGRGASAIFRGLIGWMDEPDDNDSSD